MTEKKVMKLASRGKRFGAAVIDSILPAIAYMVMMGVLHANGIDSQMPGYGYGYGYGFGYDYGYNIGNRISGTSALIIATLSFIMIAYLIVECVFYAKGKSIGKAILGLQVVSSNNGSPFRFGMMLFREIIVKSACASVFFLGYIWILIDDKNRGWHDKILDSYVVDLKESEKMNLRRRLSRAEEAAKTAADETPAETTTSESAVADDPEPDTVTETETVSETEMMTGIEEDTDQNTEI